MQVKRDRSFRRSLWRAIRLLCPNCGAGRLFGGLIRMEPRCRGCHFVFERSPGYFLGSTYINYGVTAVLTTAAYVIVHFGFGVDNSVLVPALLMFCLVFPLVFFRFARSLWLSVDCYLDPPDDSESRESPPGIPEI